MVAKNKLGILVYVDNNDEMVEEFSWLFKSAIYSGVIEGCELIVVCHPDVAEKLPRENCIRLIPALPYAERNNEWADYKFVNSIGNLVEPAVHAACSEFEYILKTDCDTFVTPHLKGFEPSGLCFGFGAYAYQASVRRKLDECSERWGYPHIGLHNIGASVLGPTDRVLTYLNVHMQNCNRLLEEEFADFSGQWPNWTKQVLTMYAGELALRMTYPQQCSIGLLDNFTQGERKLASDVLHVHAWHTDDYWSKHKFRAGEYHDMDPSQIDRTSLGGYCHWLAAADLEDVKAARSAAIR
ncbi:hypothetical protein [Caballeronia sp. Lep1P3]|uniref:DUF7164 domain-containing protein n=1 Tax=Caballeronia sp. Lep1P3 TaxID=2878150 RepID=UPI001FD26310|nr:hypothetical protein [Caballeronia sp. Lep1P3]